MAREMSMLSSPHPINIVPAEVKIHHVQLRDVIICPRERGVLNYVRKNCIVEHNINAPDSAPRTLANLPFAPNTLASMQVPGMDNMLLAAGGQETEIHLSLHGPPPPPDDGDRPSHRRSTKPLWRFEGLLTGASILNSVLLTSMSLTRSNESSVEPRIVISNNDQSVKFYDVPVRGDTRPHSIKEAGMLKLPVPVNHSSLSPDGRTLLSVGDSTHVYLHRLSGGSRLSFTPITKLVVPPADPSSLYYTSSSLAASFSTAFSANGTKFAVASQEGAVVVWDVRSTNPLKVFQTDKNRISVDKSTGNNSAGGWLSDDPFDWTRGPYRAPGWGARNVKFGCGDSGREIMTFTEHTSLVHVIDARTFETEEIIRMPSCAGQQPAPLSPIASSSRNQSRSRSSSPARSASSSGTRPPPPPRIVMALEDTFRIPTTSRTSISPPRWRSSRLRNRTDTDDDLEGIVVIPPLGDPAMESEVRQLLGRHGIRTRHSETTEESQQSPYGPGYEAYDTDEQEQRERENIEAEIMEVDELESDCITSSTPSRSSSPPPSQRAHTQIQPTLLRAIPRYQSWRERQQATVRNDDLDLAGMCFDPSGRSLYVASVDGIAEWAVKGAEKKWWLDSEWA